MHRDHINLGVSAPNVRGRARVQLFDARTGALSLDVTRDNFVSERWLRALAWYANWGAFSNNTTNTSLSTTMAGAPAFGEIPFSGISLTDYDGMPDQAERLVRGNPLAHASKGVAGGGDYRGSYNAEESVHEFGYHRFVYDFATSGANGTFQSIYTGMFNSAGNNDRLAVVGSHAELNAPYRDADAWWVRNPATGALYECWSDAIHEVVDWSPMAYGGTPERELKADLTGSPANGRAFAIRDGRMYWLTAYSSSTRRIMSAPLGNLEDARTEKVLDGAWAQSHGGGSSGANYVTGLAYHPSSDRILISVSSDHANAPKFAIMSLDPATFDDDLKWGSVGGGQYGSLTTYVDEPIILASDSNGGSHAIQLEGDGSITLTARLDLRFAMQLAGDIGLVARSSTSAIVRRQYRVAPAQHFFSRALLDQPVEKTSQNTMKITYEFTFDEPVLP